MKVTYISHSGFLVETETVSLLFDYWNGRLPAFTQEKPLYIFSSHRHEDHFNPEIFSLSGRPERTEYLLSYDILRPKNFYRKYPQALPLQEEGRIHSLRMDQDYAIGDLEIWPLKSTDEGVGFLLGIPEEKLLIYHAGDLNWWMWEGEPDEQNRYYTGFFKKEVSLLADLVRRHDYHKDREIACLDLGFFTMDPRQEIYEFIGFDYYLQNIPVRYAFPMHCWDDYEVIDRYLAMRQGLVREMLPGGEADETRNPWEGSHDIFIPHIRKRGEEYGNL